MTLNIHLGVVILIVIVIGLFWGAVKALQDGEGFGAFLLICFALVGVVWAFYEADPQTEIDRAIEDAKRVERRRLAETPHVVREADGCKVYAFASGDKTHFFTRCPDSTVTTDTTRNECTGSGKLKSCRDVVETIVTSHK